MNNSAKLVSLVALIVTIVPSLLYFTGTIEHEAVKWTALVGTAAWFIATPIWMGRETTTESTEVV